MEDIEEFLETLREAAPMVTSAGLIGVANMVLPQTFTPSALSGSAPTSFTGPQPGQPGGGSLPTANTPSAIQARNVFQLLQNGAIAGISGVGIGSLVAVFDLPRTPDNFGATAG